MISFYTDTSPIRTFRSVPSVSVLERFDCISNVRLQCRCSPLLIFRAWATRGIHKAYTISGLSGVRFVETNFTLIRPSPTLFVCNPPDSGRHVTKHNQGLWTGRRENLWLTLKLPPEYFSFYLPYMVSCTSPLSNICFTRSSNASTTALLVLGFTHSIKTSCSTTLPALYRFTDDRWWVMFRRIHNKNIWLSLRLHPLCNWSFHYEINGPHYFVFWLNGPVF